MYSYIIGKVIDFNGCGITLDNNGIGYFINTPNPYAFNIGEEYKVYCLACYFDNKRVLPNICND